MEGLMELQLTRIVLDTSLILVKFQIKLIQMYHIYSYNYTSNSSNWSLFFEIYLDSIYALTNEFQEGNY